MIKKNDPIRIEIAKLIKKVSPEIDLTLEEFAASLVEPPNSALGDFAFGCFIIAFK